MVGSGFSGYAGLAEWLAERSGMQIGFSQVQRHAAKFRDQMALLRETREQARAMVNELSDEGGDMVEGLVNTLVMEIFTLLAKIRSTDEPSVRDVSRLADVGAKLARSAVSVKEFRREFQERMAEKADAVEDEIRESAGPDLADRKSVV